MAETAKNDKKKVEDLLFDFVTRMEREGEAPGYISGIVKTVRSWLRHNDVEFKIRTKIPNPNATPSIEDERVPTQEELKIILMYASESAKVSITLMAFAGLVRASLSKAGHKYFTFLPREGCEYLAAYLEKRIAEGEELAHISFNSIFFALNLN